MVTESRHTIFGFIEAMVGVAVACEDCNFVPQFLQANGSVNDKTFSPSNAKVWVNKHDISPCKEIPPAVLPCFL